MANVTGVTNRYLLIVYMTSLMVFAVSNSGKLLVAVPAVVWLLTSMRPFMY
jgi:hypothetical protein